MPDGPDNVIEILTRDPEALFDLERGFSSRVDCKAVMRDDASFIGTTSIWEVSPGKPTPVSPETPMRSRTPGVKRVTLLVPGMKMPPDASRSVADDLVAAGAPRRHP